MTANHEQERSQFTSKASCFVRRKLSIKRAWSAITSAMINDYEPARHYMRGPGPKTRARQAQADAHHD